MYAAEFALSQSKMTINVGETYNLDVTDSSVNPRWTAWSINKARVDQDGVVTGVKAGKAIISARVGLTVKTCAVTVLDPTIKLNKKSAVIYSGEGTSVSSVQLKAISKGSSSKVKWESSNPKVATVDEKGKVTSVSAGEAVITTSDKKIATVNAKGKVTSKKAGKVTITAEANGVKDTVIVKVHNYIPTVKLNYNEYVLYTKKGNTVTLKAVVDGTKKAVNWESTEPEVATVKNGKVTALKEGQTVIKATADGITEDCLITVKESEVLLEVKDIAMGVGETKEFPVDVVGNNQKITYKTTNGSVVSLKNGILTAKKAGEADICNQESNKRPY